MGIKKFEKDMLNGAALNIRKKRGDLSYPIHRHDYFEIIFYSGSEGTCLLNGEKYQIGENSIFFLTPEDFHRIETKDIKTAYYVNISFSKSMIASHICDNFSLSAKVVFNPSGFVTGLIEKMEVLFEKEDKFSKSESYHLLNTLLIEIIKTGQTAGKSAQYMHPVIGRAMTCVLSYPERNLSLNDIAGHCHISPAYFSHIFHKEMGKPFKKWVNQIKIEHACRLLENSELSVLEVSLECGFHSISHFGKIFKNTVGITPKEYRKRVAFHQIENGKLMDE